MKGEVVVVPFPFSDLITYKKRPALILADLPGEDIICAAITSAGADPAGIPLSSEDFDTGGILRPSTIRASKLFTLTRAQIERTTGRVKESKRLQVVEKVHSLMK